MPAYVIANVHITDRPRFMEYSRQVPGTLEPYGGRYVVRGGRVEVLEGEPGYDRLVVIEFADAEQARSWYSSEAYDRIKHIRLESADATLALVEGYSG
jgi:uncharacterized protein (DUF1330 family)